ncbi:AraC family transcriptional regulator [Wukongibacter baidiensis]|uniref:helix-turn-helix domain-containing protein n=1 Tax=Wukongibacter baidiensis TaxID=1723361 RepID=UPI003D7F64A6
MISEFSRKLEILDGLETNFIRVLYYDFSNYYKDNYCSYEYNRLCTIIEGEKKVKINNEDSFIYNKDKFVLLPSYSKVEMEIDSPTKALVLELSNDLIKNINDQVTFDYKINNNIIDNDVYLGLNSKALMSSISKISSIYNSDEQNKEFLLDLCAQEIVYNLLKDKCVHHILSNNNNPISMAIDYMMKNYNRSIKIQDLAHSLNMSSCNFTKHFKQATGITPKDYLKRIRMKKARTLLLTENVTEVAYDLGYDNISYFIRLFKNEYGMTPKHYKSLKSSLM